MNMANIIEDLFPESVHILNTSQPIKLGNPAEDLNYSGDGLVLRSPKQPFASHLDDSSSAPFEECFQSRSRLSSLSLLELSPDEIAREFRLLGRDENDFEMSACSLSPSNYSGVSNGECSPRTPETPLNEAFPSAGYPRYDPGEGDLNLQHIFNPSSGPYFPISPRHMHQFSDSTQQRIFSASLYIDKSGTLKEAAHREEEVGALDGVPYYRILPGAHGLPHQFLESISAGNEVHGTPCGSPCTRMCQQTTDCLSRPAVYYESCLETLHPWPSTAYAPSLAVPSLATREVESSSGQCSSPVTFSTTTRDENDRLLLLWRDQGISYKEIKARLNCAEAESTLRGRYRAIKKPKSQRLRKPVWTDTDIEALVNCVTRSFSSPGRGGRPHVSARWKHISEEIFEIGGHYLFGPGTCKKKYKELVEQGSVPPIEKLEQRRAGMTIRAEEPRTKGRRARKSAQREEKASSGI